MAEKLGYPKPEETFKELYGRARTAEWYESAALRNYPQTSKKALSSSGSGTTGATRKETRGPGNDLSESSIEHSNFNCREPGHIARYCKKKILNKEQKMWDDPGGHHKLLLP